MAKLIVLDSGVLGLATNPHFTAQTQACAQWLNGQLGRNALVFIPEVADYEVRRELIRAGKAQGLLRLDTLNAALHYEPITTAAMRHAAQ